MKPCRLDFNRKGSTAMATCMFSSVIKKNIYFFRCERDDIYLTYCKKAVKNKMKVRRAILYDLEKRF